MNREDRRKTEQAMTDAVLTSKFTQDIGSRAIVKRESLGSSEHLDQLREVIADVGRDLQTIGHVPKGMEYRGSFCVHVYTSALLKEAAFATTSSKGTIGAELADGALRELTGSTMESYGKRRQKLRSGF